MTVLVKDIKNYQFTNGDHLFLDANFWLFIYQPFPDIHDRRVWTYSEALSKMLAAKSNLYADPFVLSEFANRYSRIMYETSEIKDYKKYRNSHEFITVAENISDNIRRILLGANKVDCDFLSLDHEAVLQTFEKGSCDFNDLFIAEICKMHAFTIVTHDGDYHEYGVPILTANTRLLQQRLDHI